MKIQVIVPKWSMTMPWVSNLEKVFKEHEIKFLPTPDLTLQPDTLLFMWCNAETANWINSSTDTTPKFVFLRRYEFFTGEWGQILWNKVAHLIFVNDVFRIEFENVFPEKPVKTSVIYNTVDFDKWGFREHKHGNKIAMIGNINQRKNLPLALQILTALPENYELHLLGTVQCPETFMYLVQQASLNKRKIQAYGQLRPSVVNTILDDMDYVICTAISEGNPNNINEAMAKGLKPLIHSWPGANWQYPKDLLFSSINEALALIDPKSPYESERYKLWAEERFSFKNLEQLKQVILDGVGHETSKSR